MFVSWEATARHEILENAMVRITQVGRWDKANNVPKNDFTFSEVAVERCSAPKCGAIKEAHPLALNADNPHYFI